jgi:hypothetical protein
MWEFMRGLPKEMEEAGRIGGRHILPRLQLPVDWEFSFPRLSNLGERGDRHYPEG